MKKPLFASTGPAALLLALALFGTLAQAQTDANAPASAQPNPVPTPTIAPPRNTPYPGTLVIDVDLTDLDRKIIEVRETIPVASGPLTLLYPRWIPGTHSPSSPVGRIAGLQIKASGKPIDWVRDVVDVHAFHLTVPSGVRALEVSFQHLSPVTPDSGRVVLTQEILGLQWHNVVLYPAGFYSSGITTQATAKLPSGWKFASALDEASRTDRSDGTQVQFKPVSLETLVDSPLWAGKYTRRVPLDDGHEKPVFLTIFADAPANLEATDAHIAAHKALVQQADKVLGTRHFRRYEFLLALSDHFTGIGLEHHESSENGVKTNYFTDWAKTSPERTLLPHEYAHSWNGKYRRPSDLWMPNFNLPMQDTLLWVYEGQTQYWGFVLAARSGLVPLADSLDDLAYTAAALDNRAGRQWRNLQDTTNEPIVANRAQDWRNWQRGYDYYDEATLIWLDADTQLRVLTQGRKSMDDVASQFFGAPNGQANDQANGQAKVMTYTFNDVVQALNATAAFDWSAFLRERLDTHQSGAPLNGLSRAGWKLAYTDKQSDFGKTLESLRKNSDFAYSLGFSVDKDGKLQGIGWNSPAFKAGLTPATQLVAVNGMAFKTELLREAITQAVDGRGIELLVKRQDRYRTLKIDYRGGLRYPKLVRIEATPDLLTELLSPRK